jgi:hypothetical protein
MNYECIKRLLKDSDISTVTRENVNDPFNTNQFGGLTLLEVCVGQNCCFEKGAVAWLLSMGAEITEEALLLCTHADMNKLEYLLERSGEGKKMTTLIERTICRWCSVIRVCLLIDYGTPCPLKFTRLSEDSELLRRTRAYKHLSNSRVATSRKSLCALLWCSRNGLFPALRGIIVSLARSAWAQRGGEGCGPRGHGWLIKLE